MILYGLLSTHRCGVTLFIAALAIVCGCARGPSYVVSVNAFATASATAYRRYFIVPSNEGVADTDLEFQEYASLLERALTQRGFQRVGSLRDAQVAILLSYGVGEPQVRTEVRNIPIFGQTGVSSSTSTSQVYAYGNQARVNTQTTYTPTYGVTGYATRVRTRTEYDRYVLLSAVDLQRYLTTEEVVNIWRTAVTSAGASSDLRQVFPVMIAGAVDMLGANSGRVVTRRLTEKSPEVVLIRYGAVADGR